MLAYTSIPIFTRNMKFMKTLVSALVLFSTSSFAVANPQVQECPTVPQAVAEQAYLEYFPLLEQARWMQEDMDYSWGYERPTNTFQHMRNILTHEFKGVVGPNNDTMYTGFTIDVANGPVIFTMPEVELHRYSSQLVLDSMHYEVTTDVRKPGRTVFIRKGYNGPIPKHDRLHVMNSDLAYSLVRTEVVNRDDIEAVRAVQDKMKIEGAHRKASDIFPPMKAIWTKRVQSLLVGTDLSSANQANYDCYVKRGVFDMPEKVLLAAQESATQFMANNVDKLDTGYFGSEKNVPKENHQNGRAIANYLWHLAFQPKHADYPNIRLDTDGNTMHGDNVYELTFHKGLPVHDRGFWSMTTYETESRLFVPNDDLLYKVGNKTANLNDDGKTITITYAAKRPKEVKNWMPTTVGKEFYIGVRLYEAKSEWLNGEYKLPVPVKIK